MGRLPVVAVKPIAALGGQRNGRLDPAVLVRVPGLDRSPDVVLVASAARCWRALCAAALAAGHVLKATSEVDSYRPRSVQERVFKARYVRVSYRTGTFWDGSFWRKRPKVATAAVPGTSNHGWGRAVDVGEERDRDATAESLDAATLAWLIEHAPGYGWSWELQDEPWHIRQVAGDTIPAALRAWEARQHQPDDEQDEDMKPYAMAVDLHTDPNQGMVLALYGNGSTRHIGPGEAAQLKALGVPRFEETAPDACARLQAARIDRPDPA